MDNVSKIQMKIICDMNLKLKKDKRTRFYDKVIDYLIIFNIAGSFYNVQINLPFKVKKN